MKKLTMAVLLVAALFSAKAQSKLWLELDPKLGSEPFALLAPATQDGYEFRFSRLEYYVSQISVTHDGGQVTAIADTFLHVRPGIGGSLFDLGERPGIGSVESVEFYIGVDEAHNHLDPASWPKEHPLSPKNPSMHWGWQGGYIFCPIQGDAGTGWASYFEIHPIGDVLYKKVSVTTGAEAVAGGKAIRLNADYAGLVKGLDLTSGISSHGTLGAVVNLMKNAGAFVFSAKTSTDETEPAAFSGSISISPNPARGGFFDIVLDAPTGFDYQIRAVDGLGRVVLQEAVEAGSRSFFQKKEWAAGIYFIQLLKEGRPVAAERLVVE